MGTVISVAVWTYLAIGLVIACLAILPKGSRRRMREESPVPIPSVAFPVLFIVIIFAWVWAVETIKITKNKED